VHSFAAPALLLLHKQKLDTKTLTGRYDMKQLIKVQQVRA